jgi:hypothetical protein
MFSFDRENYSGIQLTIMMFGGWVEAERVMVRHARDRCPAPSRKRTRHLGPVGA